ncbi:hypothetical protein CEP54_005114 [Fusarium duplospermum]|uniref:Uncharacterized protein n=1 Tax=Fusarium duplospermum TaxID=1325734 RepID=A0A428QDY4_9HYPO|nr:hypothetical protein CEP54_005114 [Fusarium duplospermum]
MSRASPEEGEVDHIDLTFNPEDLMDVDEDEDENREREESSLFLPNSMTPPPSTDVTFVDLVANDDEPDNEQEIARGRSDSSLFVHSEPEDEGFIGNENNDSDDSDDIEDMIINIDDDENDNDMADNEDNEDNDMNDNEDNEDNDMNDNDDDNENEDNDDNHMNNNGNGNGNGNGNNNNNNVNDSDDDNDDNGDNDNSDTDDSDDGDGSDNDDHVPSDQKDLNATLHQALGEEEITEPEWAEECLETCKPHWDEVAYSFLRYRRRFLQKRTELRNARTRHRQRVRELNARIQALKARQRRRPHMKSWPEEIRLWVERGGDRDWKKIYKLSCKEENMSWCFSPLKTHPGLRLRLPTEEEKKDENDEEETPDPGSGQGPPPNRPSLPGQSPPPGGPRQSAFERLDIEVQIKIFSYLFVFEGELVHAISRLDPHHKATQVPLDCDGRVALPRRFHIGQESVSLTFGTIKPQELLAPLLVSKHFNYLGASLFYGANTLQHLQHVEILWIGSQRLIYKRDREGRYTSRRTHHLAWFSEVHRLKSISIYTPESSKGYMRRRHEPPHIVEYMAEKTIGQPNYRRFRALRTLQGLDYLHVLRGLNGITFWDYDKWLEMGSKLPVRDWTFVRDLNNTVRRAKTEEAMERCRLRMLAPLVIGYRPRNQIMNKIENFVNQYSAGCGGQVIDLTLDDD